MADALSALANATAELNYACREANVDMPEIRMASAKDRHALVAFLQTTESARMFTVIGGGEGGDFVLNGIRITSPD